jgi:hypothetical protein
MSYDLFFKSRCDSFTEKRFQQYFQNRRNYKCEASLALYENEETGVYFTFELQEKTDGEEEEFHEYFPVAFNINFFRPSCFIVEAEPEVTAFVKYFDLLVSDPQMQGMGDGEYDAEKLLLGWNYGNEFGYSAILKEYRNRDDIFHLPTVKLHDAWRWNLLRNQLQDRVGSSKFVPMIMFMNIDGSTVTASVWPDGTPVVIAPVDYLCIPRKELAPRRLFRKKEDTVFVKWEEAFPLLSKYGSLQVDESISLNYLTPPSDVVQFVQSLPVEKKVVSRLSFENVLDREICERVISF